MVQALIRISLVLSLFIQTAIAAMHSDPNLQLAERATYYFENVSRIWMPYYDRQNFYRGLETLHQLATNLRHGNPGNPPPHPQKPTVFIQDAIIKGSASNCSDEAEKQAANNTLNACFQGGYKKCDVMATALTKLRRWHDVQLNTWYDCEADATVHGYK